MPPAAAGCAADNRFRDRRSQWSANHRSDESVNPPEPPEKFRAFGYAVREVDGNDTQALVEVFNQAPFEAGKPNLVLAHTIKGKGVSFIENSVKWHHQGSYRRRLETARRELIRLFAQLDGR